MIANRDGAEEIILGSQLLPHGWERAFDKESRRYFYVDHERRCTTWLNPCDRYTKPANFSGCYGDQLPYGWERVIHPISGMHYTNHIERKNQWTNPVDDWRKSMNQHHYSNSHQILSTSERLGTAVTNNATINDNASNCSSNRPTTSPTATSKPDTSFLASDVECSATSLNNSTSIDAETGDSLRSNNISRASKYDASLLDIMDNCFGHKSSQSVEV